MKTAHEPHVVGLFHGWSIPLLFSFTGFIEAITVFILNIFINSLSFIYIQTMYFDHIHPHPPPNSSQNHTSAFTTPQPSPHLSLHLTCLSQFLRYLSSVPPFSLSLHSSVSVSHKCIGVRLSTGSWLIFQGLPTRT